ncbi:hypothetical protein RCO27_12550 [Sphingosinicella sp. LHD-64]|uniref:hypothetical protein n=1 Tax=Sphingosinicella sp. LHD-64 TaxID=3072139 RepID=UPI00280C6235|nr:hypothetical protein [Sphingosinicella sp. LHD-64]MDQ8757058.1 hypothetical protein [Sphingosinicella sp. LHD-64]
MSERYDPIEGRMAEPRQRGWPTYLILALIFFLIGIAAMGWVLSRWEAAARFLGVAPAEPPVVQVASPPPAPTTVQTPGGPAEVARPPEATPAPGAEPQRIVIDPEITRRVAAIEARLGQVDSQSRAAVGNADRAEGLLVAFAARRALDRGVSLGFLEALLRQRFGATQPQAVGTIIAAAREPVTLQELQDGLGQIAPQLVGEGPQQSWWGRVRAELGSLIIVRREGTPSPVPAERLRRATRRLEAGQVDVALAEVMRLPGREAAREWVVDARRYVLARRALDTIETAALLEPRMPTPTASGSGPATAVAPTPAPATR